MRAIIIFVAALACAPLSRAFTADAPSLNAVLSPGQIYEGESVNFEIQIKGLKEGHEARPDMKAFSEAGFEVEEAEHGWTGRSEQVTIINGQVNRKVDHGMLLYRYRLTPKRTGKLALPAAHVEIDGTVLTTQQLSLNVTAPEQQDIAMLELTASQARVFPMKPFTVTLKILLKPIPGDPQDPVTVTDPPALKINWKDAPEGLKAPDDLKQWLEKNLSGNGRGFVINDIQRQNNDPFQFFDQSRLAVFNFYSGREKRKGADGAELNYYVYQLARTFIPTRPGQFKFGAATLKGTFADGFESGNRRLHGRALLAVSPEKIVVCEDFPEPKPANFSGAIGQFKLEASTGAHDLRVGDPLTMKLDFVRVSPDGAGPLEDIAALNISSNAQISADFLIVEQATSGQVKGATKSFTYVLRPKKAGVSIGPISASVFNPDRGKYEEISSAPIALGVTEAPQLRPDELVSSAPLRASQKISGTEKGVFQNITDLRELNQPALNPLHRATAAIAIWIVLGAGIVALRIRRKRAGDVEWQKRQRSAAEAAAHLNGARAALKEGHSQSALLEAQRAVSALIGRRAGIEPAGMTARDAAEALEKMGVAQVQRDETVRMLEAIEATKYGSSSPSQADASVRAAEKLIVALQAEMDGRA